MSDVVKYTDIKPADACRYDGMSMGEVMLRMDPQECPLPKSRELKVYQGGGETNVACGVAYTFGLRSAVLTALVDDNIGLAIRNQIQETGADCTRFIWFNTDNDGSKFSTDKKGSLHNGINFTYRGKGILPANTDYYRAHTPIREIDAGDWDFDKFFGEEGVRVFNTGGIYTLLSPSTPKSAQDAMEKAAKHGTFTAFDLNYRSKVEPDKERARKINREICKYVGFLVGNDTDMDDALGYPTTTKKGASIEEWFEAYKETVLKVSADFPNMSLIGTQWRGATNADMISWAAVVYDAVNKKFHMSAIRRDVPIFDRVGGGDSFCSGVMSAIMKGHDVQTAAEWGAAHGILVQETPGDITMITQSILESEVKRGLSGGGVKVTR
jgi:2-dehydro-3-deoxygluconokinase